MRMIDVYICIANSFLTFYILTFRPDDDVITSKYYCPIYIVDPFIVG